jgi:AraC family transcriptional regulator, transcriptional activator of pobA
MACGPVIARICPAVPVSGAKARAVTSPGGLRRVAYQPDLPSPVRAEVQRLDGAHPVLGYGPHVHDFFEVVIFDTPGGVHVVDGEPATVSPGQAWLLPPGVAHDLAGLGGAQGWILIAAAEELGLPGRPASLPPWPSHLLLSAFRHADEGGRLIPLPLDSTDLIRWTGWLTELARERAEAGAGHEHAVRALLCLLLVDAARRTMPPRPATTRTLVDGALAVVEARFRSALSLSAVARELAVTPGHLTELVRRQTGRPLGEWIQQRRLAEARMLLAETDQPVGVIASSVGFADAGTFSRQFRRRHGHGPSAWRAAVRQPASAHASS